MRRILLILPVALLTAGVSLRADGLLFGLFEGYLESLRKQAGIPGLAAAIVGEDGILWERGFGLQDIERSIATRPDTPFHLDGLTQVFTSALVLRCVEDGRLSLDDRIGSFDRGNPEADATVRQLLTHTSIGPAGLVFNYNPDRLAPLSAVVPTCIDDDSFRETIANTLDRFAMRDSVPGADSVALPPPLDDYFDRRTIDRYAGVLERLATPYAVDKKGRATKSSYATTDLNAASGLISTARDLAQFDLALRKSVLLRGDTLAAAWRNPTSGTGLTLPHGIGWFVQVHNGELVAWQFGVAENASSSLLIKVPGRGLTLILLANSDRLAVPLPLAAGDVNASPMGRLFLRLFVS
ncbi:MAG: serine hydrolase domain-containing protein [Vicinamibacterales bacterium]